MTERYWAVEYILYFGYLISFSCQANDFQILSHRQAGAFCASCSNILFVEVSKELLNTIADNLEAGEKCFIHKVTFEIITYPEDYILDLDPDISI